MYMGLGYSAQYNRNGVIERLLSSDKPLDWVQIFDDDHGFAPETLIRLLDHMYGVDGQTETGIDIIVPLYAQRQPPCHPCLYKSENADGSFNICLWRDLEGKTGAIPVVSAGAGGIVIKRKVVEALKDPWFEYSGKVGEDHYFLRKARAAGFSVYCALDVQLDHMTTVAVRPYRDEKTARWCGEVDLGGKQQVRIQLWDETYQQAPLSPIPESTSDQYASVRDFI